MQGGLRRGSPQATDVLTGARSNIDVFTLIDLGTFLSHDRVYWPGCREIATDSVRQILIYVLALSPLNPFGPLLSVSLARNTLAVLLVLWCALPQVAAQRAFPPCSRGREGRGRPSDDCLAPHGCVTAGAVDLLLE